MLVFALIVFCGILCQWHWFAKDVAKFINLVKHYMEKEDKQC